MKTKKFESPEEMKSAIDEYFKNLPKKTIITKEGAEIEFPFVSITGLALGLGFASRQSLYDYEGYDGFAEIIKAARLMVENNYEFQLIYGNTTGAIFALKQFGWTDKVEQTTTLEHNVISATPVKTGEEWLKNIKT